MKSNIDMNGDVEQEHGQVCQGRNGLVSEIKRAPKRHLRFINCVLVFCVTSGILTTCVVIHLGIENYNRLRECRELRSEIFWLKWRMGISQNKNDTSMTGEIASIKVGLYGEVMKSELSDNPPPYQAMEAMLSDSDAQQANAIPDQKNSSLLSPQPKFSRKDPLSLFDNDISVANLNSQVRHCMARVKRLEDVQFEYGNSQDFLRQQMHQRFASIENLLEVGNSQKEVLPSFSASLSRNSLVEPYEHDGMASIVFDTVLLNEGSAYDQKSGKFVCPLEGLYVFHVAVVANANTDVVESQDLIYNEFDANSGCTIYLRVNGQSLLKSGNIGRYSDLYQGYDVTGDARNNDVTLFVTLVTRLERKDVVDTSLTVNCLIRGQKTDMISTFQGYYLHG